jgi:hypothetical protein
MAIEASLVPYIPQSLYNTDHTLKVSDSEAVAIATKIKVKGDTLPDAQKAIFVALATGADITPVDGKVPADLDATLDALAEVSSRWESLSTGNALDDLVKILIQLAADQKKAALDERLNARESAKSSLIDQAGKQEEAASKTREGAIVSLVLTVVAAAITIVSSAASLKQAGGALKAAKESVAAANTVDTAAKTINKLTDVTGNIVKGSEGAVKAAAATKEAAQSVADASGTLASTLNARASSFSGIGNSVSSAVNQSGAATSSLLQADAKDLEAQGSRAAADAQEAQSLVEFKKEVQQNLEDLLKAVIQFIKALQDAKVEQLAATTRV